MRWLSALVLVLGCKSADTGPYVAGDEAQRDTTRAQELNAKAADVIDSDAKVAEGLLREALTADIFFGPAHNNLGVLYYNKGLYEEAVGAFMRALELDSRMQVAQRNLEIAYLSSGAADQRISELREHLRAPR